MDRLQRDTFSELQFVQTVALNLLISLCIPLLYVLRLKCITEQLIWPDYELCLDFVQHGMKKKIFKALGTDNHGTKSIQTHFHLAENGSVLTILFQRWVLK